LEVSSHTPDKGYHVELAVRHFHQGALWLVKHIDVLWVNVCYGNMN